MFRNSVTYTNTKFNFFNNKHEIILALFLYMISTYIHCILLNGMHSSKYICYAWNAAICSVYVGISMYSVKVKLLYLNSTPYFLLPSLCMSWFQYQDNISLSDCQKAPLNNSNLCFQNNDHIMSGNQYLTGLFIYIRNHLHIEILTL